MLKEEFPHVDFDLIESEEDTFFDSMGSERETDDDVGVRGRELLDWIRYRPESNIVVVSRHQLLTWISVIFHNVGFPNYGQAGLRWVIFMMRRVGLYSVHS